ncbi:MAG: glucokinase [Pseudomonadota bacterium]|nr:glucokinase [Pseudomonadota bacterium]
MIAFDSPRLIADIGGLYARFAIETSYGEFAQQRSLRCADFPSFEAAMAAYLGSLKSGPVAHAAVAIANPVDGDQVRMTNYHWQFSIEETRANLGLETLVVVNDFTSLAMALPRLSSADFRQVGPGQAVKNSVIGLIGSGSGLGVSGLIPSGDGWTSLGSEGGHTSFAPADARESAVLQFAWQQFQHVSFERLLSGPGLELTYLALAQLNHQNVKPLSAPDITRLALDDKDLLCTETLEVFCNMLGTAASNLAVTLGATGGIYIGGSIVPRLGEFFDRSGFRKRFEEKGRFTNYVAHIPTFVITAPEATFLGASAILDTQLRALLSSPGSAILTQIRRSRAELSPAEQRVADLVLSKPRSVLSDPIHDIALAAQVSQPTVIRFCRSVGCKGLSDFKLRLASGLSMSVPITHSQVTHDDSMLELGAKVLGNTANAILQLRNELQRESIDRAIELVAAANRVELFAVGNYAAVAQDAQTKFLRLGLPCGAHTDPHLQDLTAATIQPGTVALIISSGGKLPELMALQEKIQQRGATLIAITANQSPLARKADVALVAEHNEHAATHLPMVSRVLHLLLIDILIVGLEMRHLSGATQGTTPEESSNSAITTPGIRLATPLKPYISHSQ